MQFKGEKIGGEPNSSEEEREEQPTGEKPEKIEPTEIEKEIKLPPQSEIEEKEKRDIAIMEKLPLGTQDKMNLILTYFGEKPTSEIEIEYHEEKPYVELEEVFKEKEELERKLASIGLDSKILEKEEIDENGFERKGYKFLIAKDREKIQALESALQENNEKEEGTLFGFPDTAVEAFSKGRRQGRFKESMLDEKKWWRELSEEERSELKKEKLLNFRNFKLSREHWKEELEKLREWRDKIREKTPELFQEISETKPHIMATAEEIEIEKRKKTEKYIEEIKERVGKIKDAQGKSIEKGIKETVIMLNAFDLAISQSCEGHFERAYSSGPWVEIYSRLANKKESVKIEEMEEIKERMTKQNLHFKRKATNLLNMFYEKREVSPEQKLCLKDIGIFHGFRIQSQEAENLNSLSEEKQKEKLAEYRKEMKDFTKFLKEKSPLYSFKRVGLDKEQTPPEEKPKEKETETPEEIEKIGEEIKEINFADLKRGDRLRIETPLGETPQIFEITVIGKRKDGLRVAVKSEFGKEIEEFTARMPGGITMDKDGLTEYLKVGGEEEKNCLFFQNLRHTKTKEKLASTMRTTPIQRIFLRSEKNESELSKNKLSRTEIAPESSKLKIEGEKIYKTEFVDKLDEILAKKFKFKEKNEEGKVETKEIVLKDVIEEHLKKFQAPEFSKLSKEQKTEIQKEFVKNLTEKISKIPASSGYSFYFERALKTGEMNCSACASLNSLILENTKKITELEKIEMGLPYNHAMNIITFSNGQVYYVDPRNNVFENLSRNIKVEDKNGIKVYKIKELRGGMISKIVPTLPVKEGIIGCYVDDLHSAFHSAQGALPEGLKGNSLKKLEKIQNEAKKVCEEKGINNESFKKLKELKEFFNKKVLKYQESKEFKTEVKRIKEFRSFVKDLDPFFKLFKENKEVKREIMAKKNKISRFLLYGTVRPTLENKKAEKQFRQLYQKQRKLRESNFAQYREFIKQVMSGLKSIR